MTFIYNSRWIISPDIVSNLLICHLHLPLKSKPNS